MTIGTFIRLVRKKDPVMLMFLKRWMVHRKREISPYWSVFIFLAFYIAGLVITFTSLVLLSRKGDVHLDLFLHTKCGAMFFIGIFMMIIGELYRHVAVVPFLDIIKIIEKYASPGSREWGQLLEEKSSTEEEVIRYLFREIIPLKSMSGDWKKLGRKSYVRWRKEHRRLWRLLSSLPSSAYFIKDRFKRDESIGHDEKDDDGIGNSFVVS